MGEEPLTEQQAADLSEQFLAYDEIASARLSCQTEDFDALKYSIALSRNPYSVEALDFFEQLRLDSNEIMEAASIDGETYFSVITPKLVDERDVNNSGRRNRLDWWHGDVQLESIQ